MLAAGFALLLAVLSFLGTPPLVLAVLLAQGALSLAWLSLTAAPAPRYSLPTLLAAALAADVLALRDRGHGISASIAVVALGFLAALLGELARRDLRRVTESFAVTVTGVVLVVSMAGLVAARAQDGGRGIAGYALLALGAACLLRSVVRGVPGLLAAVAVAPLLGLPGGGSHVAIAAATGIVAVVAATAVESAAAGARGLRDAERPLGVVVPLAACGPVVYAVSRLLLT